MHCLRMQRHGDVHNVGRLVRSNGQCSVDSCDRKHFANGLCGMHSQRQRRGRMDLPETLTCVRCDVSFPRPYKSNPDVVRFCSHECRYAQQLDDARNSTTRAAAARQWRIDNPALHKANTTRRTARRRSAGILSVTSRDIIRLVERFDGRCAYCRERPYQHLDHVVPIARGGRHGIGNLLPACAQCNLSKGSRLLADWRLRPALPRRFRIHAA